jgi:hypothetical protein
LTLDPRFADSNPAEDNGFLRALKSGACFSSEGKKIRQPHVLRFYCRLKIPVEYDRDMRFQVLMAASMKFSSTYL